MLKGHKSKTDTETSPECSTCKAKEIPEHFLLNCKEYNTYQAKLEKDIKKIFHKNNCHKLNSIVTAIVRKKLEVCSGNRK